MQTAFINDANCIMNSANCIIIITNVLSNVVCIGFQCSLHWILCSFHWFSLKMYKIFTKLKQCHHKFDQQMSASQLFSRPMIRKSARHEHGDASATIPRTNADNMDISIKISKSHIMLFYSLNIVAGMHPFKKPRPVYRDGFKQDPSSKNRVEHEQ